MSDEAPVRPQLSDRAAIALLTLQVRTAEQEAVAAEAAAADIDEEAAVAELRAQLLPLEEERQRSLDAALVRAEAEAARSVDDARARVAAIDAARTEQERRATAETREDLVIPPAGTPMPAPTQIVIDAESFARVFATVIAEALEQRGPSPYQQYFPPMHHGQPAADAHPSFWRHARHPDVLLLGLATIIIVVVLFAWLG